MTRISAFTKAVSTTLRDVFLFLLFCVAMFAIFHFIGWLIGPLALIGLIAIVGLVVFCKQVGQRYRNIRFYQKIRWNAPAASFPHNVIV